MVRSRTVTLILITMIVAVLVLAGCQQAPTPTPTPTPTPAPAPAPAPAPTPTPAPAPAPAPKVVDITFWGLAPGTEVFDNTFTLTTLINRYSQMVRATIQTSEGAIPGTRAIMTNSSLWPKTIWSTAYAVNIMARNGTPPFTDKYLNGRGIALYSLSVDALSTYDPNIKTKDDLAGKRIMLFQPFFTATMTTRTIIQDVWGLSGKVQISYGGDDDIKRALQDGTIDVGMLNVRSGAAEGPFDPSAALSELNLTKPGLRFITETEQDIIASETINKVGAWAIQIPAGIMGPTQTAPAWGNATALYWTADASLSADVVYDITKVLYEHMGEYNQILPAAHLTQKSIAELPTTLDQVHPGALKLFQEKGVKVGR